MHKFEQNVSIDVGIPPSAAYTAAEEAGVAVDMAKYNNYAAIIAVAGATENQGALTCVIAESTDNSTWSNTYLGTVTIASATTDAVDTVEVRAEEMSDGYRYLRTEVTPAAGTENAFSVANVRFNPRFKSGAAL